MKELKNCFKALGFTEVPKDAAAVAQRCGALMERHGGGTETDKLARAVLIRNRDLCYEALEAAKTEETEGEA